MIIRDYKKKIQNKSNKIITYLKSNSKNRNNTQHLMKIHLLLKILILSKKIQVNNHPVLKHNSSSEVDN